MNDYIKKEAAAYDFKLSSKAAPGTLNGVAFEKLRCEEDFANGRTVRRVFEQIRIKQAVGSELTDIEEEDARAAADSMPRGRTIGFQGVVQRAAPSPSCFPPRGKNQK